MEIGEVLFLEVKDQVQKGDLDVINSAGMIISAPFGTLINLRHNLEKLLGKGLIYYTISGAPLYLVKWNDLSEKKRGEIDGKRRIKRALSNGSERNSRPRSKG